MCRVRHRKNPAYFEGSSKHLAKEIVIASGFDAFYDIAGFKNCVTLQKPSEKLNG